MTSDYLKACAAAYLRYIKQCPLVAFERGLDGNIDNPDILAVTKQRQLIEVEVKISLSDFKHDASKTKWHPAYRGRLTPRMFYYCVPPELVDKVQAIWPCPDRGLLTLENGRSHGLHKVYVVRKAKVLPAKTLPAKHLLQMALHQSGTLISVVRDNEVLRQRLETKEKENSHE